MNDMPAAVFIFMCVCVCVYIPVKGAWSCWSSWSQCSVGCGGGHYQRTRSCNSPAPANGGDICIGLHTEEALCNTHTCDGKVTHKFKNCVMPPPLGILSSHRQACSHIPHHVIFVLSASLNGLFHHFLMNKADLRYMTV